MSTIHPPVLTEPPNPASSRAQEQARARGNSGGLYPGDPAAETRGFAGARGRGRQGNLGHPDPLPAPPCWSQPSPCRQLRSGRYTTSCHSKERPWGLEDSPGREAARRKPLRADGRVA